MRKTKRKWTEITEVDPEYMEFHRIATILGRPITIEVLEVLSKFSEPLRFTELYNSCIKENVYISNSNLAKVLASLQRIECLENFKYINIRDYELTEEGKEKLGEEFFKKIENLDSVEKFQLLTNLEKLGFIKIQRVIKRQKRGLDYKISKTGINTLNYIKKMMREEPKTYELMTTVLTPLVNEALLILFDLIDKNNYLSQFSYNFKSEIFQEEFFKKYLLIGIKDMCNWFMEKISNIPRKYLCGYYSSPPTAIEDSLSYKGKFLPNRVSEKRKKYRVDENIPIIHTNFNFNLKETLNLENGRMQFTKEMNSLEEKLLSLYNKIQIRCEEIESEPYSNCTLEFTYNKPELDISVNYDHSASLGEVITYGGALIRTYKNLKGDYYPFGTPTSINPSFFGSSLEINDFILNKIRNE